MRLHYSLLLMFIGSLMSAQVVAISEFANGFSSPVEIAHCGDSRLFVVQQSGAIRVLNADGTVNPTNFLTLTNSTILSGGERGLLGLAFHPNYATNGYFFLNYTRAGDGATVIARYSVSTTNPNLANATSGSVLLTIPQPFSNHNGGTIKFGPDGYLYVGMGDGGSGGDPGNRAQNINENLGKMLRLDVDGAAPYGIPANNPYVGIAGNDEIWAIGLRNPWKFSFDVISDELWIADVGQNEVEEINLVPSTTAGLNFGWRCYEGNQVYTTCSNPGATFTFPFAQYTHGSTGGCSITGGYRYAGGIYPNFFNKYFFADYCLSRLGMVNRATGAITYSATFPGNYNFTTFGQDINGELYVASPSTGKVYKIIDSSLSISSATKHQVSLYPNPAESQITVDIADAPLPVILSIYDLSGKLLHQNAINTSVQNLDIGFLRTGLYLVNTTDGNKNSSTVKLSVK